MSRKGTPISIANGVEPWGLNSDGTLKSIYCLAITQRGVPCGRLAIRGTVVCRTHGGKAPHVRRKGAQRVAEVQLDLALTKALARARERYGGASRST
jgi:hypothetical protein